MKSIEIMSNGCTDQIDWTIPQWVVHIHQPDFIILTIREVDKVTFEGTALPCKHYKKGSYDTNWGKNCFKPLKGDMIIKISN